MARQITVLIAEDHDVVREGLRILINSDPRIRVAAETDNGQAAVRLARQLRPDVILMDLAMPGESGLAAARDIRQQAPESKVLVLSAYHDEETIQKVIEAGALGYLTKHSAAEELLTAIAAVNDGRPYYSTRVTGRLRARHRLVFHGGRPELRAARLTEREQEVLALVATGKPNKQIADVLGLSVKTVEKHRQAAMDKLDIHDTAGLTRYAVSRRLVAPAENQAEVPRKYRPPTPS